MSTVPHRSSIPAGAIASFARRHTLTTFFILVFALTWPLQVVDALGSHGLISFRVPLLIQIIFVAYMPTAAALFVACLTGGGASGRALLRKLLIWRVAPYWYLIAIFSYALLCGAAVLLANGLSSKAPVPLLAADVANTPVWQLLLMVPLLFVVVTITNGEELAWRGFALPRLQDRHSALVASLILGVIWAAFHLPLFLTRMGPPLDILSMISRST